MPSYEGGARGRRVVALPRSERVVGMCLYCSFVSCWPFLYFFFIPFFSFCFVVQCPRISIISVAAFSSSFHLFVFPSFRLFIFSSFRLFIFSSSYSFFPFISPPFFLSFYSFIFPLCFLAFHRLPTFLSFPSPPLPFLPTPLHTFLSYLLLMLSFTLPPDGSTPLPPCCVHTQEQSQSAPS